MLDPVFSFATHPTLHLPNVPSLRVFPASLILCLARWLQDAGGPAAPPPRFCQLAPWLGSELRRNTAAP
eukprot:6635980-Heterocapsa_arctica.AAC.1